MLSAESAVGQYPVQTVAAMAAICIEAEKANQPELDRDFRHDTFTSIDQSVAMGALFTAFHLDAKAIISLTESGSTPLWMSRHWVQLPIFALTSRVASERAMALYRNVTPLHLDQDHDRETAWRQAVDLVVQRGLAAQGDVVVLTAGRMGQPGGTNTLKIMRIGDDA
jgi:pyruvate kinase